MCNPNTVKTDSKEDELLKAKASSPRHAIELAIQLNELVGHENHGCLSFTHGFAPRLTPPPRLPEGFEAWDQLGRDLPKLWSSGQLQRFIDEDFPQLDATKLPPEHALRAAHILGITIHAYWHVGGLRAPNGGEELVPKNLERPWYYIVMNLLHRDQPFMGFYEMLMAAFNYPDRSDPVFPHPLPQHKMDWKTENNEEYGMYEYDPEGVRVETLTQVVSLSGVMTEKAFFCSFAEMNCRGAPILIQMMEAQEAAAELAEMGFVDSDISFAGSAPHTKLKNALSGMKIELEKFSDAFAKIHGMRASKTYVDPTVWAEAVAPVDKPFPGVKVGPSGAGMPLSIALDAFFQRSEHGNFIGKEVKRQLSLFPKNWNRVIHAIREYTAVGPIISAGKDNELKGLFYGAFDSYCGDTGFLGIHRLKMYGYMEFTKKLARGKTTGYAGLLRDRIWNMIAKFMHDAMLERKDVPLASQCGLCSLAKLVPTKLTSNSAKEVAHHVKIDISETGIRYSPGDRLGVLYESDEKIVKETLDALAQYDKTNVEELENLLVAVNNEWREALRARPEYHKSLGLKYDDVQESPVIPHEIPLSMFLRYAKLRPASRDMVRVAYAATLSPMLLKFLETHRESLLQVPDLIHWYARAHPNATKMLLRNDNNDEINGPELVEENCERMFKYADLYNEGFVSRKSFVRIGQAAGTNDSAQDEIMGLFDKYDTENSGKLDFSKFKKLVMDSVMQKQGNGALGDLFQIPSICDMVPPIEFRVYSIAGSDKDTPGELHLCVEKVRYTQKDPTALVSPAFCDLEPLQDRFGASSNFLKENTSEDVDEKDVVIQYMRQPAFHLPPEGDETPVIMFAAGSGLAPFRGFWQELAIRHKDAERNGTKPPAKALFILQARSRDAVPFASEIASMVGSGVMDVKVWLSREDYTADFSGGDVNWVPAPRGYVHKSILEGGKLRNMLEEELSVRGKSCLYMCSGAGFATNIMNSISDIIGEDGIETIMSHQRLKLEVFTSTKYDPSLPEVKLSDILYNNYFRNPEKDTKLEIVIDGMVYDMKDFATRHPGGTELIYMYCGMDSSAPWRAVGHDKASEVKSLLDMYIVGRLKTPHDNVHLACSTESIPLKLPKIINNEGLSTTVTEVKTTSLRRYYADSWDSLQFLYMESQNILTLAFMQFWDGGAKLTSAEPKAIEVHACTWAGKSTVLKKKSVVQGQMFSATHRKLWNELLPTIFGDEFAIGLSATLPTGIATEMAEFRMSDLHTRGAAFVDLVEEIIVDYVNSDEGKKDGRVPPRIHAFYDHVRIVDEDFFDSLKPDIATIIKCFENYGSMSEDINSTAELDHLLVAVEKSISKMHKNFVKYCEDVYELSKDFFTEKQVDAAYKRLKHHPDEGGYSRLFSLPSPSN